MKRIILLNKLDTFVRYTTDFVGMPVKSRWNEMFKTYPSELPNTTGEVSIFLDSTALHKIDVRRSGNSYFIEPDIWIGETGLFNKTTSDEYPINEIEEKIVEDGLAPISYFVVLRRLGDDSVNYCIENKLNNVYLMSIETAKEYYFRLTIDHGYPTMDSKILDQNFVDENYLMFNILEK